MHEPQSSFDSSFDALEPSRSFASSASSSHASLSACSALASWSTIDKTKNRMSPARNAFHSVAGLKKPDVPGSSDASESLPSVLLSARFNSKTSSLPSAADFPSPPSQKLTIRAAAALASAKVARSVYSPLCSSPHFLLATLQNLRAIACASSEEVLPSRSEPLTRAWSSNLYINFCRSCVALAERLRPAMSTRSSAAAIA
mmetsp:Transcript_25256/g.58899  ORF Transcript_25256/g.58899 Transcript_25256/m.58899 type:complete len:201 (-) Transcript_25256:1062-1664(-)